MSLLLPNVPSPLVPEATAKLVNVLKSDILVDGYREKYNIDVREYFRGIESVAVYECEATSYRFYYPFSLVGQESLYKSLSRFDWNYKSDKWEYGRALDHLTEGARVLDVGCGRGAFLKLAGRFSLRAHGLELNASAVAEARGEGLSVSAELVGSHVEGNRESYDAVCAFQVLEHIPDVREFIGDCVSLLKPGGNLIFGVPNNDSFMKHDPTAVLNAPPHHMGLWSQSSLGALANIFPIELTKFEFEPLMEPEWYQAVMEAKFLTPKWLLSSYYRLGFSRLYRFYISRRTADIPGHTILAFYRKR